LSAYQQLIAKVDSALQNEQLAMADLSIPGFYVKPKEGRKKSFVIQTDGFSSYSCVLAWQLSGKKNLC